VLGPVSKFVWITEATGAGWLISVSELAGTTEAIGAAGATAIVFIVDAIRGFKTCDVFF